jgi:secondary thiamine-phosphate synthase enzyme
MDGVTLEMGVYVDGWSFETEKQFQVIDLTDWIRKVVADSGIEKGIAIVFTGHTTGALVVNENEVGLMKDLGKLLKRLLAHVNGYEHPMNSPSHLISMILSHNRTIPIRGGRLILGRWQSLLWLEVENRPRNRRVEAMIIGE